MKKFGSVVELKRARHRHYKLYGKYKRPDRVWVGYDPSQVDRAREVLSEIPQGVETAVIRALNRALAAGRAEIKRAAKETYTVKPSEVNRTIRAEKPKRGGGLQARLISTGRRLPLESFAHRPMATQDTTGNRRKQIRVGVRQGELKPLRTGFKWQGRILARGQGNHLYPEFNRGDETPLLNESDARFKYGLSVPEMLGARSIRPLVEGRMKEVFEQRFDHEVQRILEKGDK